MAFHFFVLLRAPESGPWKKIFFAKKLIFLKGKKFYYLIVLAILGDHLQFELLQQISFYPNVLPEL